VIECERHDLSFSALDMPFADGDLAGLYMLDVFHHIPDVRRFLEEAARCLAPGGKVVMLEPANTLWGRFIYRNFHHEPFEPAATQWSLPAGGPMSMANGALPWIVFVRDRDELKVAVPDLTIRSVQYCYPFRYLISGGVSMRQLLPGFAGPLVRFVDATLLAPLGPLMGMFMRIVLVKSPE
jgi:SAM-dependent methyltransferase